MIAATGAGLQGQQQMIQKLTGLSNQSARKLSRAAANAGLSKIAAALKAEVNAMPISGELKAGVRQLVGKRLNKDESAGTIGKVGFGVGKQSAKKKQTAHARNMASKGAGGPRGVGLSASNVHWFVLGTEERQTSIAQNEAQRARFKTSTSGGHRTGRIDPGAFAGAVARAAEGAAPEVLSEMCNRVTTLLAKEAAGAGK